MVNLSSGHPYLGRIRSVPTGYHPPLEEYLETIHDLAEAGTPVIQARIAERLGRAAPSVSEMLDRLQADGSPSPDLLGAIARVPGLGDPERGDDDDSDDPETEAQRHPPRAPVRPAAHPPRRQPPPPARPSPPPILGAPIVRITL